MNADRTPFQRKGMFTSSDRIVLVADCEPLTLADVLPLVDAKEPQPQTAVTSRKHLSPSGALNAVETGKQLRSVLTNVANHPSRDHQAGREAASRHLLSAQRLAATAATGVPLRPGSWCRVPASRGRTHGQMAVKRSSAPCPARPVGCGEQEVCPPQGRCEPVPLSDPG